MNKIRLNKEDAIKIGDAVGIDWETIDVEQFRMRLEMAIDHNEVSLRTNATKYAAPSMARSPWRAKRTS